MPDNSLNCFSLSNICELMSLDDTLKLFKEVYRTGIPDARICFRNLVIPREVPECLIDRIIRDKKLSEEIFNKDRSFVYSKVAAYRLEK
jgi:S-adenosylmethionine-diacylglycerol 3-amino-3-carboxypropyl transferase